MNVISSVVYEGNSGWLFDRTHGLQKGAAGRRDHGDPIGKTRKYEFIGDMLSSGVESRRRALGEPTNGAG